VKSDVFEEVMADVAQRYGTFDNGAARPRRRSRPHLVEQPRASGCLLRFLQISYKRSIGAKPPARRGAVRRPGGREHARGHGRGHRGGQPARWARGERRVGGAGHGPGPRVREKRRGRALLRRPGAPGGGDSRLRGRPGAAGRARAPPRRPVPRRRGARCGHPGRRSRATRHPGGRKGKDNSELSSQQAAALTRAATKRTRRARRRLLSGRVLDRPCVCALLLRPVCLRNSCEDHTAQSPPRAPLRFVVGAAVLSE